MKKIQKTISIVSLICIIPTYSISKDEEKQNRTTHINKEIKNDTTNITDITLDNSDKLDKLLKTGINNITAKNISHGKGATNINIEKVINNTNIAKNYFNTASSCLTSCGVAIQTWDKAKEYCSIQNKKLPSKNQIINNPKYKKKECSGCTYWTNSKALRYNGEEYPEHMPKVYVYDQAEKVFLSYATKFTHVATCLSK